MGACFSQEHWIGDSSGGFSAPSAPIARVISVSGQLHEYAIPVTVLKVLEAEISSSSSRSSALFLCNSDALCYEEIIPAMGSEEQLAKDQIYFALPKSRLGRPLSASDMAALAVKASLALQKSGNSKNGQWSRISRRSRISPVMEVTNSRGAVEEGSPGLGGAPKGFDLESYEKPPPPPPAKKYRRSSSSRRLNRAVRSFRIRLSTIQEGPESVHSDQCC